MNLQDPTIEVFKKWKRKKILNVSSHKQALVAFLCKYTETNAPDLLSNHPGRKLFLAGGFENGEEAKSIGLAGVQEAVDFYSTHEEADTRMILYAVHANNVFERNDMTG